MSIEQSERPPVAGAILLADDDMLLLEVTREFLEDLGYRVVTAGNGLEAVSQYKKHRSDIALAVFDVMMPQLNGPEAAERISAIDPSLPFIFVTGYDSNHVIEKAAIPQGFRVMHKPTDFNTFSNVIQKMIAT